MDRKLMTTCLTVTLASLGALAGCSKAIPCTPGATDGGGCYDVSGLYQVVVNPVIHCPLWNVDSDQSASMFVTDTGANVTVTFTPSMVANTSHAMNGTQYVEGLISVQEQMGSSFLGIPYGQLNGTFSSQNACGTQPPFNFQGTFQLLPSGNATSQDGGSAPGCTASYTFKASQTTDGMGNALLPENCHPDGGLDLPDGG